MNIQQAPALQTTAWFNTGKPLSLDQLRGKVVMIEAFQMLCPGCVSHGLPLAERVYSSFSHDDLAVIGLHSVFEHHAVQGTQAALEAFLHEYKFSFPVAMDRPSEQGGIPQTMQAYQMQGTPTLILIDRQGQLRHQHFGLVPELRLGADIMLLIEDSRVTTPTRGLVAPTLDGCDASGCAVDQSS